MPHSAISDVPFPRTPTVTVTSTLNLVTDRTDAPSGSQSRPAGPPSAWESAAHVLLLGPDSVARRQLRSALDGSALTVTDAVATLDAALAAATGVPLDVALVVDPPEVGLSSMIRRLRETHLVRHVVVLSAAARITGDALVAALAAGADGWLSIDLAPDVLIRSIQGALRGEPGISRRHVGELVAFLREPVAPVLSLDGERLAGLTPREHEIFLALAGRGSVKSIAQRLSLSEVTVRWYTSRLLRKLDVSSRFELAGLLAEVQDVPTVPGDTTVTRPTRPTATRRHPAQQASPQRVQRADSPRPVIPDWRALPGSERRVVEMVVKGMTNRQIAEALFLSKHTIDTHVKSAFAKLGVRSRVELTLLVHRPSE